MQHDVFALPNLQDAIKSLQYPVYQRLFGDIQWRLGLNDDLLTFEQYIHLSETICGQSRTGRYEITDVIGYAKLGRDFDGAREIDDLRRHILFLKVFL